MRPAPRLLYFDIDGVLLDYDNRPKRALVAGVLEGHLKACEFDRLVCVSGWVTLVRAAHPHAPSPVHLAGVLARTAGDRPDNPAWSPSASDQHPLFPDAAWFLTRLRLIADPGKRCEAIDLTTDWWYADDFAADHFVKVHGRELFERQLGKRILQADPLSDGANLLTWLRDVVMANPRSRRVSTIDGPLQSAPRNERRKGCCGLP